ncbi:hypothetical protein [Erythrobacter sp.]|uniref:hypothetical protein n=2 Tax=Erythrobacter sp. TaxID=1042 RepID=UPI0025BA054A|nr:hypothetical protein [Erythrobacter sp.]
MAGESDPLPYLVHTNRELGMMLRGEKPLARFTTDALAPVPVLERYLRMFDRHVEAGRFCKQVLAWPGRPQIQHLYFVLPGEEWRIAAMAELLFGQGRWTLEHERREGELLGYTDWQNDIWIDRCQKMRAPA